MLSKTTFTVTAPLGILLLLPVLVAAQPQRGFPQFGMPKPNFGAVGADKVFRMMSGNQDHIIIKQLPGVFRRHLENYARAAGITDGKVTRSQFMEYMEQQRKVMMGMQPPMMPQQNRREQERNRNRQWSPLQFMAEVREEVEDEFRDEDRNGDGVLDDDEAGDRIMAFDADKDGRISKAEFSAYIRTNMERRHSERIAHWRGSMDSIDTSSLDGRPVVYRAGNLPEELEDSWFKRSDIDKDGQVGLYEWLRFNEKPDEFQVFDRNSDGFVTAEEVLRFEIANGQSRSDDDDDERRLER